MSAQAEGTFLLASASYWPLSFFFGNPCLAVFSILIQLQRVLLGPGVFFSGPHRLEPNAPNRCGNKPGSFVSDSSRLLLSGFQLTIGMAGTALRFSTQNSILGPVLDLGHSGFAARSRFHAESSPSQGYRQWLDPYPRRSDVAGLLRVGKRRAIPAGKCFVHSHGAEIPSGPL